MDYRIRPASVDDAAAVAALMAAAEAVDDTGEHYAVDDVVEEMANPGIDVTRDWLLALDEEDEVVGSASLRPRAPSRRSIDVHVEGVVRPDRRGRGIGSALLERMLTRADTYAAERGLALVARGACPSGHTVACGLLEEHGFVPHRWQFVMEVDLAAPPAPVPDLPAGYTIVTWEGVEDDELRAAHNLAFDGFHPGFTPWDAPMWTQWVSGARAHRPALSLVARDGDGGITAYLQTAEFDAVAEATGRREAFVAKVGTSPEHRRSGLAAALLGRGLALYREAGFQVAALDVDSENPSGALGVYQRAGFSTAKQLTFYRLA